MKNRDYKTFAPDEYYHIFNRGTGQINIFKDDNDYNFFLFRLREALFPVLAESIKPQFKRKLLPPDSFTLVTYCLMPNHFHLLIRQNHDLPISQLISKVCTSYSMYFNKKYKRVGSLFQDQFKAVLVESDEQFKFLSAYIHQNPFVAGLVKNLKNYKYSSYPDYLGKRKDKLCDQSLILDIFENSRKSYEDFVEESYSITKEKKELALELEGLILD